MGLMGLRRYFREDWLSFTFFKLEVTVRYTSLFFAILLHLFLTVTAYTYLAQFKFHEM